MITYLFLYSLFFIFSFFYFYLRDLKIKSFKKNDLSKYSLSLSAFTLRDNSEHTSYVHSHLYTYNALARVFFFVFFSFFIFLNESICSVNIVICRKPRLWVWTSWRDWCHVEGAYCNIYHPSIVVNNLINAVTPRDTFKKKQKQKVIIQ